MFPSAMRDTAACARAADLVALMTPVVKAFLTDSGSEAANLGMQVLGGHGYIRANGQEQLVRDVRITQIYEGTNGVQAMDLLARKVLPEDGRLLDSVPRRGPPFRRRLYRQFPAWRNSSAH